MFQTDSGLITLRVREREREKEKESVCTFTVYMCLLSGAEKEMTSSQQRINTFWW